MGKEINEMLRDRSRRLIKELEAAVNAYEYETGVSVNGIKVLFNEDDCKKHVMVLCDYYNFEGAMVRRNEE